MKIALALCALVVAHVDSRSPVSGQNAADHDQPSVIGIQVGGRTVTTVRHRATAPQAARQGATGTLRGYSSIINGSFVLGLDFWETAQFGGSTLPGSVTVDNEQAQLLEGDSFLVSLWQTYALPPGATTLSFDLFLVPGFDLTSTSLPDAFEVHLLDENSLSVVPTWHPAATSFFNIQEDASTYMGSSTTYVGSTITLDLSSIPAGTEVTLRLDLIGADSDTGSGVRVDDVESGGVLQYACTPSRSSSIPGCAPVLTGSGGTSISKTAGSGSYWITASPVPGGGTKPAILIYTKNGLRETPLVTVFGDLCLNQFLRAGAFSILQPGGTSGTCTGSYSWDFGGVVNFYGQVSVGDTLYAQGWYRDPPNPGSANFTEAMGPIAVQP